MNFIPLQKTSFQHIHWSYILSLNWILSNIRTLICKYFLTERFSIWHLTNFTQAYWKRKNHLLKFDTRTWVCNYFLTERFSKRNVKKLLHETEFDIPILICNYFLTERFSIWYSTNFAHVYWKRKTFGIISWLKDFQKEI